ncbi:MAG: TetR/AcrR family transcriptional regulator [Bacteroidales bacterium]|nr:TetR/AcrR family transcriptional regulator [Bacteroidales bacterium]
MVNSLQTEDKILITAREVFIREGYDGARMQHIADEAGINKALLHYYYGTKEKLFTAVFEHVFTELLNRIFSLMEEQQSLEVFLNVFFREHITFLLSDPRLPAFIINEVSLHPELLLNIFGKFSSYGIGKFGMLVEKEKEKGLIAPGTDPLQLFINILSLSIFPVVIEPIISNVLQMDARETETFLRQRIEILPEMVLASVRKDHSK